MMKKKLVIVLFGCCILTSLAGCRKTEVKESTKKEKVSIPSETKEPDVSKMGQAERGVYKKFKDQKKDKDFKILAPTDDEIAAIGEEKIGIGIPSMVYLDEDETILNDEHRIYAYSFKEKRIKWMCDIAGIGFTSTEGDEAYVLNVSKDGTKLYLTYALLSDGDCYAVIDVQKGSVERTIGKPYNDLYQPKIDEEQENSYSDVFVDESGKRVWMQVDQKGNKKKNVQIGTSYDGKEQVFTPFSVS